MRIERHEMGPRFSEMSVVHVGDAKLIYIAGQVAENTSLDIEGQMREVLAVIDRLLAKAGASRKDVVRAHIFLASVGDYPVMNSVWDDWVVPGHTPARVTTGAKLIYPGYKVEIEITAAVPAPEADSPQVAGSAGREAA